MNHQTIRSVEASFRNLFESIPDAAIMVNANGEIVLLNHVAERMFAYDRDELLAKPLEILLPERYSSRHKEHRALYFKHPRTRPMGAGLELYGRRKDGGEFPLEISLSLIETEAGPMAISVTRDISERKRFEQSLQHANRMKSEFLANMSHELRTPLNAVIGFAEFLTDQKAGALNEQQRDYLNEILNNGRHLLQLINGVLDLSKIEAGKMDLHVEDFSLRRAIVELQSTLTPLLKSGQLQVKVDIESSLDMVALDANCLRQILSNLLSNAIKFTAAGGSITIQARHSHVGRFEILVRDTGIGIRSEDLQRLFVDFQQLDAGPSRRFQGTGLGLSLTKKLAELMQGHIRVVSEIGQGSTFIVDLPLQLKK